MGIFNWLFGSGKALQPAQLDVDGDQQAVLIRIDGRNLTGSVEDIDDLATVEDLLIEALGDRGEVDGHDVGADDATIYCYGPDAVQMFELMRNVLASSNLTKKAKVTLRFGDHDAPSREFQLGAE